LPVVIGYADLLLRKPASDEKNKEPLAQILEAAERAKNLTRQLLAFGRKQMLEIKAMSTMWCGPLKN